VTDQSLAVIVTAICTSAPPTLMALLALLQGRVNARKADENSHKADVADIKTDSLVKTTGEIHALTNDHLSSVTSELKIANEKIIGLEKLLTAHLLVTPVTLINTKDSE